MTQKATWCLAGTIFSIVTLFHGVRTVYGWPVVVGNVQVPVYVSGIAVLVAGFMTYQSLKFYHRQ